MMFGYGDDAEPFEESVELMEDLLIDYVTDLAHLCMRTSVNPGRLQMEDVLFLLRKDEKKFARCKELLETSVELKKTMKAFNSQDLEMKKKRQLELQAAATEQRGGGAGAAGGAAGGTGAGATKT